MSSIDQITIGLAGHIDHGKTSLVKSLTGINTDNLDEEIKRGMTINIGFAHMSEHICLIDVPGHEKFIKNMVSGVCNVDFIIMVIAADDGIMPQTVEHFEIIRLLNIKSGIIVINKIDLVEKEWLDLIENDVKDFFVNTFLEGAKIFKTSSTQNIGIPELKEFILLSKKIKKRYDRGIFRMFVDRVFKKTGFGSIVTGTVISGKTEISDKLKLQPSNKLVKVRGIQSHDNSVSSIKEGDRGAINIHSIDKVDVFRGCHLSSQNNVILAESAIVNMNILSKSKNKLKHNQRIRFLLGTQEVMGRILFVDNNIDFNKEIVAIVKFENSIIACFKDNFIIRSYSPITTIGGGSILDINIRGKWKHCQKYAKNLFEDNRDSIIIRKIIEKNIFKPYQLNEISEKLALSQNILKKYCIKEKVDFYGSEENPWLLTNKHLDGLYQNIIDSVDLFHKKFSYSKGLTKEQINNMLKININLLSIILTMLVEKRDILLEGQIYSSPDFKIILSKQELKIKEECFKLLDSQGFNTYNSKELAKHTGASEKEIVKLLNIEQSNKKIIVIDNNIIFTNNNYLKLRKKISVFFKSNDVLDIKEFKLIANTTRKYAVPLLEFLDKEKVTFRIGNSRKKYE